jgi:hypothetical protein
MSAEQKKVLTTVSDILKPVAVSESLKTKEIFDAIDKQKPTLKIEDDEVPLDEYVKTIAEGTINWENKLRIPFADISWIYLGPNGKERDPKSFPTLRASTITALSKFACWAHENKLIDEGSGMRLRIGFCSFSFATDLPKEFEPWFDIIKRVNKDHKTSAQVGDIVLKWPRPDSTYETRYFSASKLPVQLIGDKEICCCCPESQFPSLDVGRLIFTSYCYERGFRYISREIMAGSAVLTKLQPYTTIAFTIQGSAEKVIHQAQANESYSVSRRVLRRMKLKIASDASASKDQDSSNKDN